MAVPGSPELAKNEGRGMQTRWCGFDYEAVVREGRMMEESVTHLVLLALKLEHNIMCIDISCVCLT
jgi:hypothetical protein